MRCPARRAQATRIDVNGPGAPPLFEYLKSPRRGPLGTRAIKWNFTKFLVGRDGVVDQVAATA